MTGNSTELFLYRVSKVTAGIEKYCGATFKQNQTDRDSRDSRLWSKTGGKQMVSQMKRTQLFINWMTKRTNFNQSGDNTVSTKLDKLVKISQFDGKKYTVSLMGRYAGTHFL